MPTFKSILVANRGEIAVRVMRTARALGLKTIAVYSEADVAAPHVRMADEAVLIGPPPVGESYLDPERILQAARTTGAEAIHPGYGFLSENAAFARACLDAGLVFIGPPPEAIELMGNKAAAKRHMIAAGVPCVPGYEGGDQAAVAFTAAARTIGFPVMVKAAAGGGGRGMRLVQREADLGAALELARSEAASAFGSGELILEKAIVRPRHVEIQVFGDTHGNVIHLGERDCSVQRRHQKVVEEAPCPVMTDDLRAAMGAAAVEAARSIGYEGAGTVEFLLDEERRFYFLEMNTRLQVEHPVTEMITGQDLVAMQIHVAEGAPLALAQDDVRLAGHAIEVRLYAEDPSQGFLPSTGTIELWRPARGEGLRFDSGVRTGLEVSPFYDPMLAKVIAWGPSREIARRRLIQGLEQTGLLGPRTNRDFLLQVLRDERFARGEATTAFIVETFGSEGVPPEVAPPVEAQAAAAVVQYCRARERARAASLSVSPALANWTSTGALVSRFQYLPEQAEAELRVTATSSESYQVAQGTRDLAVVVEHMRRGKARLTIDGRRYAVAFHEPAPGELQLSLDGTTHRMRDANAVAGVAAEAVGGGHVIAPMHGLLLEVSVAVGDRVAKGARLAVLEAMKMQHEILATVDGVVQAVHGAPGTQIAAASPLIDIEPDDG